MIRRKTGTVTALLLSAMVTASGAIGAETPEAVVNYGLTDPATGKTGTARVPATVVISENMVIEYVSPMNLGISGVPGKSETLRLIAAGNEDGRPMGRRNAPPRSASISVQGMPNQTFAISIDQARRSTIGPSDPVFAAFTHNAGQTPHIGPVGDTEFMIGATLRMKRNADRRGYSGILDLIVSHN